ncbi:hypothetical protein I215_01405 [Galbibacter marinus]|uniref:Lipocalin-like domain-containing protein n=1 Tax=Galbibacter marinus TaxID=555500 RepID=K2PZJ8_9FLAO|nr:DUF5004 domain-containing protein [Galbibacter marinus]EKF56829.1 hypothetical protein I215_01405 [Galbibacter marinus]
MKKQKLMAVVLFAALTGVFVSCNDDDNQCIPDYTGALSADETAFAGEWHLTAIESSEEIDLTDDDEDNPSTDIFAQQSDCQNDLQYDFGTDRIYKYSARTNVEDCEDSPAAIEGTWKFGGSTLGLITACTESVVELDVNDQRTTFSYTISTFFTKESGERIEIDVTHTFTKGPIVPTPPVEEAE